MCLKMGFDKHFHEDHCYSDDPTNYVAMNVEIKEENDQFVQRQPATGLSDGSNDIQNYMSYETMNRSETSETDCTYLYLEFCGEHSDLFLHEDEKLVKPGDKFESHNAFVQYLNENAKRWYFYYKCSDSRKPNTQNETYTYNCVYLRNKEKYKKKGLRKRNNNMKTDCPCKIKLRHLPNEKELTVVYVCNHHDHDLSLEQFNKLQHGRRLPPYVREEIMDFLTLKVDKGKIKNYVEMETGLTMARPFFYALEKNMLKTENYVRQITEERLEMLNEKIALVDEMFGYNDNENSQHIESYIEETETPHGAKRVFKNIKHLKKVSPVEKSRTPYEATSTSFTNGIKIEPCPNVTYTEETLKSVKNLQDLVKCEIQKNPWVSDQCVPVLPNRTALVENLNEQIHSETLEQDETENSNHEIVYYYDPSDNQEITSNDFEEVVNDDHCNEASNTNDIDNIAYETVVTDGDEELHDETEDYAINDNENNVKCEIAEDNSNLEQSDICQYEIDSSQNVTELDHVEYMIENDEHIVEYIDETNEENTGYNVTVQANSDIDNEHTLAYETNEEDTENDVRVQTNAHIYNKNIVEYIDETNEENTGHHVGVQTNTNVDSGKTLLPLFDVYMKDGNVMGFVVDNNLINRLKDGVDKGIQTSEDIIYCDTQEIENEDLDIILDPKDPTGGTFTKHEYVHKYNIDQYMTRPHFPKYIQMLAKETYMDVLHMFTNVYNEKAMFKLTTTQKGKEGNTRIRYITHNGKIKKKRTDDIQRENLGKKLQSIFIMKEKVRMLKKENEELLKKNEYLQEVALKLIDME